VANLASIIKEIRIRKKMSMADFGVLLGVTHAQVSRYESGRATPGYLPLSRLLGFAEGAEKNAILDQIGAFLGPPTGGEQPTQVEMRAVADWFARLSQSDAGKAETGTSDEDWREVCSAIPNLAQLVEIVGGLFLRRREVDPSLVQIVLDWDDQVDDADPIVRQCFRDASEYLEYLLEKRTHGKCWRFGGVEREEDKGTEKKESEQDRRSA
jgi:transcriptional regulator with XRE-family HTH domain